MKNTQQSNTSKKLSPELGRDSTQLKIKEQEVTASTLKSIALISSRSKITPADAWHNGTNVRAAFKYCPRQTHAALTALLKSTLDYLNYNKTIRETEHFIEAVDHLIEEFPAMKIEEWRCIMTNFKAGKYGNKYERLMLPELVEAFQIYEGERAERREAQWKHLKNKPEGEPLTQEQKDIMKRLLADLDLPEPDYDDKGRWKFIEYPNSEE